MSRRRSGFTLIELLVVIAIIAILAAILFPVYAHVKEKGREASCKSNMKQIAYAMQMYLDDWNGCFPDHTSAGLTYTGSYSNQQGGEWIDKFSNRYRDLNGVPAGIGKALRPYVKSLGVFERVQFSGNCRHSERSAKRGCEESAFDYVAEKQIPHFVRNDTPARLNSYCL